MVISIKTLKRCLHEVEYSDLNEHRDTLVIQGILFEYDAYRSFDDEWTPGGWYMFIPTREAENWASAYTRGMWVPIHKMHSILNTLIKLVDYREQYVFELPETEQNGNRIQHPLEFKRLAGDWVMYYHNVDDKSADELFF